jgi:hypothetical protein
MPSIERTLLKWVNGNIDLYLSCRMFVEERASNRLVLAGCELVGCSCCEFEVFGLYVVGSLYQVDSVRVSGLNYRLGD